MGRPMRLELTRVGLLVWLAYRYTTKGAPPPPGIILFQYLLFNSLILAKAMIFFFFSYFTNILHKVCFSQEIGRIYCNTGCGRYTFQILISHLCGESLLMQVVMAAPFR